MQHHCHLQEDFSTTLVQERNVNNTLAIETLHFTHYGHFIVSTMHIVTCEKCAGKVLEEKVLGKR